MIENNKGITLVALVVTVFVIMILSTITFTTSNHLIKYSKAKAVATNMYLVKSKVETVYEEYEFSNDGSLPTSASKIGSKTTPASLVDYGVVSSGNTEEDETWYVWTRDTLSANGLDSKMLPSGENYIVNYATEEVIYTAGVKDENGVVKYKLSEIVTEE